MSERKQENKKPTVFLIKGCALERFSIAVKPEYDSLEFTLGFF